jgi:hypothetical protein
MPARRGFTGRLRRMRGGAVTVFAFACRVSWAPRFGETIYNRAKAGQAKYDHYLQVHDAWESVKYTDIRVRKVGAPVSSEQFLENAKYRGLPDLRCGQRVKVGDSFGTVVGHNSSANFDVLFDEGGRYGGQTLNVHPCGLTVLGEREGTS